MTQDEPARAGGAELARAYWDDVVGPLLRRELPGVPHAAGRLGSGSDVLGLDDALSRDHDWGLRLTLLVPADHVARVRGVLDGLPATYRGLPTAFPTTADPTTTWRVEVADPDGFAAERLGVDPAATWGPVEWLTLTGQAVLEVTAGPVFVDTHGRISRIRRMLAWYPRDLWCHLVACDWQRLDQELPFVGRTGERGDDLGSRVLAARLVRTAMHLGFLLERRWPPYPKWAGTSFRALPGAGAASPALHAALAADTWRAREAALCDALERLLDLQRGVGLPAPSSATGPFFARPFRAVSPEVVPLLLAAVGDPAVRALPAGVGSVEQWVDNVDVLTVGARRRAAAAACAATGHPDHGPAASGGAC